MNLAGLFMTLTPRSETTDILAVVVLPRGQTDKDVKMSQGVVVVVVVVVSSRASIYSG